MPMDKPPSRSQEQAEYRRRQEERAQRRKKRQMQRLIFLGACALAVVVLIIAIVLVVRSILKPKERAVTPETSISVSAEGTSAATPVAADPSAWNLILINQQSPMAGDFAPELGTYEQNGVVYYFDARILPELGQMIADCNAVEGNNLHVLVAAPGADKQNARYTSLIEAFRAQGYDETEAERMASEVEPAYGYSDHQTCLAVDFGTAEVTEPAQAFAETPEYSWLMANAPNYGFILRFPQNKSAITGITYQPYHFRYVGVADAQAIMGAGICLEEYVAAQPVVPPAALASTGQEGEPAASSSAGESFSAANEQDSPG